MILVGNQRGGASDLAKHLLKQENEQVQVHQIRGFASNDLEAAFRESYAMSRATKCKQHLFSLSLNPPQDANVSPEEFVRTIDRAEESLGLQGQPRAIVFHTKNSRRHAHAVWSRIDSDEVRAVQMSFSKRKMQDLSRELYREYGWTMPRGFVRHEERDPRNFSLAEWQQCKRAKRDPKKTKEVFQDAWAISDSRAAFANAIEAHGFVLAQGDRRGHIAVDHNGEAFAVSKYVGIKVKQVRDKLGDTKTLPSKNDAHRLAADRVAARLKELRQQQKVKSDKQIEMLSKRRAWNKERQVKAQQDLYRKTTAESERRKRDQNARIRKGFIGFIDRLTGKRKRTEERNRIENLQADQNAKAEREALRQQYISQQHANSEQKKTELSRAAYIRRELKKDANYLEEQFKEANLSKPERRKSTTRPNRRSRNLDGPKPSR